MLFSKYSTYCTEKHGDKGIWIWGVLYILFKHVFALPERKDITFAKYNTFYLIPES
jgi:hypothetical protein